jgi:hypothetical protein
LARKSRLKPSAAKKASTKASSARSAKTRSKRKLSRAPSQPRVKAKKRPRKS